MRDSRFNRRVRSGNGLFAGLIIIIFGLLMLLGNLNINIPNWILKWHTFLLFIGLAVGARRNFTGFVWLIMVLIGGLYTLDAIIDFSFDMSNLTGPILLISLGLLLILRQRNGRRGGVFSSFETNTTETTTYENEAANGSAKNRADYLDSLNIFGGSNQKVFSKNFKGGEVLAVFGGCEVDLSQADFENEIHIEITAIFGGCKIIMPPNWEVKSEISAIFGGVEDKRTLINPTEEYKKRIILKGLAMFGGVDIRNY